MSFDLSVLQDRRTATAFSAADPTPLNGQLCIETDTGRAKVGDGSTAYSALSYRALSGDERRSADDVYAAQQLSDARDDAGEAAAPVIVGGGIPWRYGDSNNAGEFNANSLTTSSINKLTFNYASLGGSMYRVLNVMGGTPGLIVLSRYDAATEEYQTASFRLSSTGVDDDVNSRVVFTVSNPEGIAALVADETYFLTFIAT